MSIRAPRRNERGQALVESAIIFPIMIFVVLGMLQLAMIAHGKVVTQYAAYCAARAGIVNNGNWDVMRNAGLLASLPIYGRTDRIDTAAVTWAKMKIMSELTQAMDDLVGSVEGAIDDVTDGLLGVSGASGFMPDVSLIDIEVTSPVKKDFNQAFDWQKEVADQAHSKDEGGDLEFPKQEGGALGSTSGEIDFDDRNMVMAPEGRGGGGGLFGDLLGDLFGGGGGRSGKSGGPRLNRLAVDVRVLYPMRIPLANWIIFQLWYAQQELRFMATVPSDITDWATLQTRLRSGETLEDWVKENEGRQVFDDIMRTTQRTREARMFRDLAVGTGIYVLPLHGTYAMQMQSNAFWGNRRQPVWFSLTDSE